MWRSSPIGTYRPKLHPTTSSTSAWLGERSVTRRSRRAVGGPATELCFAAPNRALRASCLMVVPLTCHHGIHWRFLTMFRRATLGLIRLNFEFPIRLSVAGRDLGPRNLPAERPRRERSHLEAPAGGWRARPCARHAMAPRAACRVRQQAIGMKKNPCLPPGNDHASLFQKLRNKEVNCLQTPTEALSNFH